MLCRAVLYRAMLWHAVLCHAVLCCGNTIWCDALRSAPQNSTSLSAVRLALSWNCHIARNCLNLLP